MAELTTNRLMREKGTLTFQTRSTKSETSTNFQNTNDKEVHLKFGFLICFACLREAASAKAGVSIFEFRI